MSLIIDARGLACPHPVVLTNNALGESEEVTTIVDNDVAKENVSKLAKSKGFSVTIEEKEGDFHLYLKRENPANEQVCDLTINGPTVLLIASDSIGRGSDELGHKLMTAFIQVLHEITPQPDIVIFINSGVKLVAKGSKVIEDLRSLEDNGTMLLACGTCLGFYDLTDTVLAGRVSNMYDIASALFGAGKIVSP